MIDVVQLLDHVLRQSLLELFDRADELEALIAVLLVDARYLWRGLSQTLVALKFANLSSACMSVFSALPLALFHGGDDYGNLMRHLPETAAVLKAL